MITRNFGNFLFARSFNEEQAVILPGTINPGFPEGTLMQVKEIEDYGIQLLFGKGGRVYFFPVFIFEGPFQISEFVAARACGWCFYGPACKLTYGRFHLFSSPSNSFWFENTI